MPQQLALKQLTASDLTFFDWHFQHGDVGNQKAINLNADVFIAELYPLLPAHAALSGGRVPIDLIIFGPGITTPHNLQRKIVKSTASYKNWRLNGEVVHDPEDDPTRYHQLGAGDLALLWFSGDLIAPNAVTLILISGTAPTDVGLHQSMRALLGVRKMAALTPAEIEMAAREANVDDAHPIRALTSDPFLEELVESGGPISRAPEVAFARPVSREELQLLNEQKSAVGQDGEALVAAYLARQHAEGQVAEWDWVSEGNAVAPWDFRVERILGKSRVVDVKSTSGPFANPVYVSIAELKAMSNDQMPYDIYRVFEMADGTATMRIAADLQGFANGILAALEGLPPGVVASKFQIDPAELPFGAEIILAGPDDDGELG